MNILKTHAIATAQPDTFMIYWTNSPIRAGGILKVKILQQVADLKIAAELAAMQHLLEVKRVIGTNLVGNPHTLLSVSQGAIRKLQHRRSDKTHLVPFANFLTTRFAGCQLTVDKDIRWFDGYSPAEIDELIINEPCQEAIHVAGLGDVKVTHHALKQFTDRFLQELSEDKRKSSAWKRLADSASDPQLQELKRRTLWGGVKYQHQGKQEGRYFHSARRNLVMVITENPMEGKRLVTVFPASKSFQPVQAAI